MSTPLRKQALLSISQKEELLEIIVKQAGGQMVYGSKGVAAGYKIPGEEQAVRFSGKEDLYAMAERFSVNLESLPAEMTKLGALQKIQEHRLLWDTLFEGVESASREANGYSDIVTSIASQLMKKGFFISMPIDGRKLLGEVINTPLARKQLEKTFAQRYASEETDKFVGIVLSTFDKLGVSINNKSSAVPAKLSEAYRTDPESPYKVTSREQLDGYIIKTAKAISEQNASPRVFINALHRAVAKRNLALSIEGKSDNAWLPVDHLPAEVKKALVNIYSAVKAGNVDNAITVIDTLSFYERPAYHSYLEPEYATIFAERVGGRYIGLQEQIQSQLSLAKGMGVEQISSIEALKSTALEQYESKQSLASKICGLMILETASKPALYSNNGENAANAMALAQKEVSNYLQSQSIEPKELKLIAEAEAFVSNIKSSLMSMADYVGVDEIKQRSSQIFTGAFTDDDKLRFGVKPVDAAAVAEKDFARFVSELEKETKQSLKVKFKRVEAPLREFAKTDKNPAWVAVLDIAHAPPVIEGDPDTQIKALEGLVVANALVEDFERDILPTLKVKQEKEPTHVLLEDSPEVAESAEPEPEPSKLEPEAESFSTHPEHEESVPPQEEVEPEQTVAIEPAHKLETLDVPDSVRSNILREELRSLEEMLGDIPFNDDMELMLPDEFDWFNQKWAAIVPASLDDNELAPTLNLAKNAFGPLIEKPHRRNMKEWHLRSAEFDMKSKELQVALTALPDTPGSKLLKSVVEREIAHFYFAPGVVDETKSLSTFNGQVDTLKSTLGNADMLPAYEKLAVAIAGLETEMKSHPEQSKHWKAHWNRCTEMLDLLTATGAKKAAEVVVESMKEQASKDFILDVELPKFGVGDDSAIIVPSYSTMEDFASRLFESPEVEEEGLDVELKQRIA